MSGRCRHESTTGYMWREGYGPIPSRWEYAFTQPGRADHHHKIVCDDCHAWLPLGHSDETPERVAIEIRAVEVVNARAAQRPDLVTTDEFYGWTLHECSSTSGGLRPDVEAGWLARCIWTHCDDHPDKDETP